MIYLDQENEVKTTFEFCEKFYFNEAKKIPVENSALAEENILLVAYKLKQGEIFQDLASQNIYKPYSLDNMNRRLHMFVSPEKYEKRKSYMNLRNLTLKRKLEQNRIDQKRDKTQKRKDEHKIIDQ